MGFAAEQFIAIFLGQVGFLENILPFQFLLGNEAVQIGGKPILGQADFLFQGANVFFCTLRTKAQESRGVLFDGSSLQFTIK